MKNTILFWQKATTVSLLALLFLFIMFITSCGEQQSRPPSIADEVVKYSGNYEIINDSIAVLKDGKANRNFIYKKIALNGRWKRVL